MRAAAGDRIIVARPVLGQPVRDGKILEVHGPNGEPPYLVQWADTDRQSLYFPGSDSQVEHFGAPLPPVAPTEATPSPEPSHGHDGEPRRVQTWHVDLYLSDGPDGAFAHAVLHTSAPGTVNGRGEAHGYEEVAEIGDEIAAATALRQLADHLLAASSADRAALGLPAEQPA
jgi:hypothetical protein